MNFFRLMEQKKYLTLFKQLMLIIFINNFQPIKEQKHHPKIVNRHITQSLNFSLSPERSYFYTGPLTRAMTQSDVQGDPDVKCQLIHIKDWQR